MRLFIGNKNYSSWSLRPWLVLRELGIPFDEVVLPFGDAAAWDSFRKLAPNRKVPCLVDGDAVIWDSLAIVEYLAESNPAVWPADRLARAFARSAAAEMHSGFSALRSRCSMCVGVRVTLHERPAALLTDIARLSELFDDGLRRFGGPFLCGPAFSAADAFFAPVAFRAQTYGLDFGPSGSAYLAHLRTLPGMKAWQADALAEPWTDDDHEVEIRAAGVWTADLRTGLRP